MQYSSKNCVLFNGDCVDTLKQIPDNSVHLTVSSFPFANLYTYSDDPRDFSNVESLEVYFKQLDYLIPELLRVTKPGRLCCLHVKQIPTFKGRDGSIGLIDFRGMMIQAFQKHGWIYANDFMIRTDPQLEATRTKASTILFKTYRTAAEQTRTGMPDYVITMRKWEDDESKIEHVTHEHTDIEFQKWVNLAEPAWMDIDRTNVLNVKVVKEDKDEKHMTPLQLDLIKKLINWYTNPGDVVLDPFNGIGSVTYTAVQNGRKGVGIELKNAYYLQAVKNMQELEEEDKQMNIMDFLK